MKLLPIGSEGCGKAHGICGALRGKKGGHREGLVEGILTVAGY